MSRRSVSIFTVIAREAARSQRTQAALQRQIARQLREQEREADRARRRQVQLNKERAKEEKQQYLESRAEETAEKNKELEERVEDLRSILSRALDADGSFTLDSLRISEAFPDYVMPSNLVAEPVAPPRPDPKPLGFFARLIPGAAKRHAQALLRLHQAYEEAVNAHRAAHQKLEAQRKKSRDEHEAQRNEYLAKAKLRNAEVDELISTYGQGEYSAVITVNQVILERSEYPDGFPQTFRIGYATESKELAIDYELPPLDVVPRAGEYRYVKSKDEIEEKARKPGDIKDLYQEIVASVALRTLHEVFGANPSEHVQTVVFSGFVSTIDPATGRDARPCIISVRSGRGSFSEIDLKRVDKRACLRNLGAAVSPRPDELVPVKPVVEFDMVDKRFVNQENVLADLDSRPNLMDLDPFEFENLVSNLFTKMGLDTKQTRASRDGGVDAVAFDIRPVLGGKVVIQAKRYKNTVGVSAVRDLYGTMLNEGANKGILVTTSHYGQDAHEFAKDKPIELIDGGGLLYLLEQVGSRAKIIFPAEQ